MLLWQIQLLYPAFVSQNPETMLFNSNPVNKYREVNLRIDQKSSALAFILRAQEVLNGTG
jgi:hypothetical protein